MPIPSEHHQAEIAALRAHHEEALLRLQLENERLSSSYQALEEERETRVRELEEEGEVKVRELEGELGTREERHVAEVEALQARIAELAESHAGEQITMVSWMGAWAISLPFSSQL